MPEACQSLHRGAAKLEKYSRGEVWLAASLDELKGEVEIDLRMFSELDGHERLVAGLQQLARSPGGDPVGLCFEDQLGVGRVRHRTTIGSTSPF